MSSNSKTEPASHVEPPTAQAGPWKRALERICSRQLMYYALLAVLPVAFGDTLNLKLTLLGDPDLWWHLADARMLTTTHHFIRTEPYSFSVAGQPWINPEWMAELPYWFGYQLLELRGIYLVTLLGLIANLWLVYWRGRRLTRNEDAAFWAAVVSYVLMTVNAGPRTIVFGYLALSVEMLILESAQQGNRRLLWFLPPLFCVWVNLHGTWLIGLALMVLFAACEWVRIHMGALEQEVAARPDRAHLGFVVAACAVALFVNPYSWRLVWSPVDMLLNQKANIANVAEWQPIKLGTMGGMTLVGIIVVMVLANLKRGRTWKLFELAVVFFAWYAAVAHIRFSFLAAVVVTPLVALDLGRSFLGQPDPKTIPAMNALIAVGALCVLALMFPSEARLGRRLAGTFPLRTIRSIQPQWRTLNLDYVGGMIAFESRPSFIDSRVDTFEHHGVFQDYLAAMYGVNSLEILDRYRIDHVLLKTQEPVAYLLGHTSGWQLIASERTATGTYVLYERGPSSVQSRVAGYVGP